MGVRLVLKQKSRLGLAEIEPAPKNTLPKPKFLAGAIPEQTIGGLGRN